ncbi:helix-turn-helix domain protein, partial [Bacteroides fragilis str. S23 R14]
MSDKVKRKYVKHDHEERVMAIKKVLEEGWSIRAAARLINANHRQVSFWLSTYE